GTSDGERRAHDDDDAYFEYARRRKGPERPHPARRSLYARRRKGRIAPIRRADGGRQRPRLRIPVPRPPRHDGSTYGYGCVEERRKLDADVPVIERDCIVRAIAPA